MFLASRFRRVPQSSAHQVPARWAQVIILSFSLFVAAMLGSSTNISRLVAGDWPQILGANRDSQALSAKPLASDFKTHPPKQLWRVEMGSGYAGAAITGDVAYLLDRSSTSERLTAVQIKSGKPVWQASWKATYSSRMDPDSGPRAVPTVVNDRVVCYGAAGDLVCVSKSNGKVLWNRPLRKELKADDGYFGAGNSPLVSEGVVVANIGGKKAGIVGVDLQTGKTLWQATDYDSSYSSPIALNVNGEAAALVETRLMIVLIAVRTGKVLGEVKFGARGPTVNAATPLSVGDNRYLLTASYEVGAQLVEIQDKTLTTVWSDKELLASQYNSPVKIGNSILGVSGREDGGEVSLRSLDLVKPSVLWDKPLPGPTHLIGLGNQLLMLSIDGTLQLASVEGGQLTEPSLFRLPQGVYRSLPAYSNNLLVVRRSVNGNESEFAAYELGTRE